MNYTENFDGIKLDVQAVDVEIEDKLQQMIRETITRLRKYTSDVNFVDVYITDKSDKSTNPKSLGMRFGIPGKDAYASDTGDNWYALLKNVEEKLWRQLEKKGN